MTKRFIIFLLLLVAAACSPAPQPTPDINALVEDTITARDQAAARAAPTLDAPEDNATFDNTAEVKLYERFSRPKASN